ncbi:hypothetical protein I0D68_20500 [Pseudomonas lalucatii]|nr:hypothetical protein [Pseudomonas lalucatii]QVM87461.1 hypothetical protein I0D68_20500 [Pseudomonas lalucatii]
MTRTEAHCSPRLLATLSHKLLQHLGMDFSGTRRVDLLRRLQLLAREHEVDDFDGWLQDLAFAEWDAAKVQSLISAFTVGETYFRRDAEAFDWLASEHLPALLARRRAAGRRHLRLWSAGCCTGEEAYGLLFLIDELLAGEGADWSVELVASDINAGFLARAEQGVYGRNAFRSSEAHFRDRHFQAEGRQWRVRPAWRGRIRFVQYNLADSRLPPALAEADLILCRNVLMYLSPDRALAALRRLLASLSADGALLLSAVEAGLATQAGLSGRWAGCNYALLAAGAVGLGPAAPPAPVCLPPQPAPLPRPVEWWRVPTPAPAAEPPARDAAAHESGLPEHYWRQFAQARARGRMGRPVKHSLATWAVPAWAGNSSIGPAWPWRAAGLTSSASSRPGSGCGGRCNWMAQPPPPIGCRPCWPSRRATTAPPCWRCSGRCTWIRGSSSATSCAPACSAPKARGVPATRPCGCAGNCFWIRTGTRWCPMATVLIVRSCCACAINCNREGVNVRASEGRSRLDADSPAPGAIRAASGGRLRDRCR